ncbi:PadR family transcriptional regulator [Actinomadura rugatobispora]|uniref:PadR family transcriptional regulator n=1 Tax=Actinomadura rugatobispora TaxID=1994 RepID=A0ABW0ZT28_9ACTN
MTLQTRLLLSAFDGEDREWYGRELVAATRLPQGTVYPMLARLERAGWVSGRVESAGERGGEARPPRRYLRLTEAGVVAARAALVSLPSRVLEAAS